MHCIILCLCSPHGLKKLCLKPWIPIAAVFAFAPFVRAEAPPWVKIDPSRVTVSGLSSGGYMAVQLEVAYSSVFSGAAVFAGGIYGCAEGDVVTAQDRCMATPQGLNDKHFVAMAMSAERHGGIDPLSGLSSHRIYVYAGTQDTVVLPRESEVLVSFYKNFVSGDQIVFKNDLASEHGQPTANYGVSCQGGGSPWILKCGYDGAGSALQQLYGDLNPPVHADATHFHSFSQARFGAADALMGDVGYIYIPSSCLNSRTPCALNVSLHGCRQTPEELGDAYRMHAGYNEWAESNGIIVLYPSAAISWMNPKGCWDWWGYTGPEYLTKSGAQMRAIRAMIAWLSRGSI